MKIANICPPALLDLIGTEQDYHLVLPDLIVGDERYREFYLERLERGDHVILDNGAYEAINGRTPMDLFMNALDIMRGVSELVVPDDMHGDASINFAMANEFIDKYSNLDRFMVVPHGKSYADYMKCVEYMCQLEGVTSIGIYRKIEDHLGIKRSAIARDVYHCVNSLKEGVEIHLLGMMADMHDLKDPWVQKHVRGADSIKLIQWGLRFEAVRTSQPIPKYTGRDQDYFDHTELSSHQRNCISGNMNHWRVMSGD